MNVKRLQKKLGPTSGTVRELADEVRTLALQKTLEILQAGFLKKKKGHKENEDEKAERERHNDLHDSLLKTMATASIPRLQEVSGPGGGPIQHELTGTEKKKLNSILNNEEIIGSVESEFESEGDESNDDGETG